MNAPEKLLRRYVSDYVPTGEAQHEAFAALDSLIKERERMESIVDSYVTMGPTNEEARQMALDEHNKAAALEAERDRLIQALERIAKDDIPIDVRTSTFAREALTKTTEEELQKGIAHD
jgi:hypothetical protein